LALISKINLKGIGKAIVDENWNDVIQEELYQFKINEVWKLIYHPRDHPIIGIT